MFQKIVTFLLDILFPLSCVGCGKADTLLCESCTFQLHSFRPYVIRNPTRHLNYVIVCTNYSNMLVETVIKQYKYYGLRSLAKPLAALLVQVLRSVNVPQKIVLIPIPLHRRKQIRRGFNQSALLAHKMASALHCSVSTALTRSVYTPSQSKLKRAQRITNVRGVFLYTGEQAPSHVILVDDIATTFSTLDSAAQELKKHCIRKVGAIVIAHDLG